MKHQRGVALLAAIVIFAIATAIAVAIRFSSGLSMRRAAGSAAIDMAFQAQTAAEALAAKFLADDKNQYDARNESWHTAVGPVEPVTGLEVAGQVADLDGRFNINSVVDGQGIKDAVAYEILQRLLATLDIPQQKADAIVDFVDAGSQPEPNGAEDSRYSSLQPPYRAPNHAIMHPSELLAVAGITLEDYVKLAPHVTALPRDRQAINLCTASGVLLDALANQRLWSRSPETLQKQRESGCYPDVTQFQQLFGANPLDFQKLQNRIKVTSDFFELRSLVTINSQPFDMISLLYRVSGNSQPEVRVLARTMAE